MHRNIAAILTPPGIAAIAVIRIRGPAVIPFLEKHFAKPVTPARCVHANFIDGDRVIDDALVVLCDSTTADINVHGGTWVVKSVSDLIVLAGFELLPTQFPIPDEVLDSDQIIEREIESYLPLAKTELGVRTLLGQKKAWKNLRENPHDLTRILSDQTLVHLLHPPTVAIIGPANVGKSTLANRLFAQERSITADVPGTTRDWVGEMANIEGLPVILMDTPGLRQTSDPIEATAIEQSRGPISKAQLIVLVLDATRPLSGEQSELRATFPDAIPVINKSDRPQQSDMKALHAIHTVATTGQGVDDLRAAIVGHFCGAIPVDPDLPRRWTPRQREWLSGAELRSRP